MSGITERGAFEVWCLSKNSAYKPQDDGVSNRRDWEVWQAAIAQPVQPALAVWFGSMPESNGKKNWTAILHRNGDACVFMDGITLERSEYHDRIRYEADRMRYLIGEITERPNILTYDAELKSEIAQPVTPAADG